MIEANRIVLKKSGIFHNNFSSNVILKMIPLILTLHTTPNQIIFSQGQHDPDSFIFFVEKGSVQISRQQHLHNKTVVSKPILTLGPGTCFGA